MHRNKKRVLRVAVAFLTVFILVVAAPALAQEKAPKTGFEKICSSQIGIATCVQQIYILALGLGALVALLMIVLAGYRYLTASGNAQQVEGAKEGFASAFIGLIVIFVAFILLYLVNPDLVRFRDFGFPGTSSREQNDPRINVAGDLLATGDAVLAYAGGSGSVNSSTGAVEISTAGGTLLLVPSFTSSLPSQVADILAFYNLDTSQLNFVEYEVNDPALITDQMANLMGGARPSRILAVEGSLYLFDADAIHEDTSGAEALLAASVVALNHYGVNLDATYQAGSGEAGGFRFLKVTTSEAGWVSWREIEAYDASGNKVQPATITASATYDGTWQTPILPPALPAYVSDGNPETSWNAGETNPNCPKTNYTPECPNSTRSAWILLDYGSSRNFSKIRLMENGRTVTEASNVSVSSDGSSFQSLTTFYAPIRDREWLQYPPAENLPDPTASLTVNGQKEITVYAGLEGLKFKWSGTNGDQAIFTSELLQQTTGCVAFNPFNIHNAYSREFGKVVGDDPVQNFADGDLAFYLDGCNLGRTMRVTYTMKQRGTAKAATDTVTIHVRDSYSNIKEGAYTIDISSYVTLRRGTSTSPDQARIAITRCCGANLYPQPSLTLENLPAGITARLGALRPVGLPSNPSEILHSDLSIIVGSGVQAGPYFLRIVANKGQGDSAFADFLVKVDD